jgi:hypothetical protein
MFVSFSMTTTVSTTHIISPQTLYCHYHATLPYSNPTHSVSPVMQGGRKGYNPSHMMVESWCVNKRRKPGIVSWFNFSMQANACARSTVTIDGGHSHCVHTHTDLIPHVKCIISCGIVFMLELSLLSFSTSPSLPLTSADFPHSLPPLLGCRLK